LTTANNDAASNDDAPSYTAVDLAKCCGYTVCADICPEVYKLDEGGLAYVESELVPLEFLEKALEAALACPADAIYVGRTPPAATE